MSWTRAQGQPAAGKQVRYTLDGTGSVTGEEDRASAPSETATGTVTTARYNGERLLSQTVAEPDPDPDAAGPLPAPDPVKTRFTYDELGSVDLERMTRATGPDSPDPATYRHDGLDRRDQQSPWVRATDRTPLIGPPAMRAGGHFRVAA